MWNQRPGETPGAESVSRHVGTAEQPPNPEGAQEPDSTNRVRWSARMPQPLQSVTLVPGE